MTQRKSSNDVAGFRLFERDGGVVKLLKSFQTTRYFIVLAQFIEYGLPTGSRPPTYADQFELCSLCIRKFFSYKLQCPVCNAQATEQDLQNNRLLDELVINFQAARQQLSKTYFDSPPISPKNPASVKFKAPIEKGQKCNSSVEEPMDVGEASMQDVVSVKPVDTELHRMSTEEEMPHSSSSPPKDVKPVIKVECPVCSIRVSQPFINKHLDMCLISGEKKESLRSSLGKARRPMGKLVYNLLSQTQLKRRLKECHLSVKGNRDQLIKRHKEFVHMYNAQCDSLNPKSAEEIVKEVEANEKIKNQLQDKAKPVMVFSKNHSEKEIDDVHSTYRKQHSSDFSRLVAQVRGRLDTTRKTLIKDDAAAAGGEDVEQTPSAAQGADPMNSLDIKLEGEEEKETSVRGIVLSNSPTYSEVSVSSSISDIFAPEPLQTDATERTSVKKRSSCSQKSIAASSTALGKRHRKT
ncbi:E3 ubiquitin-protein ligase RAD18 isoform X6 [Phyllopteryx taeniolatus]|uniref:E3 ubiquitin-protein ligase RAD18 isoform X6 n=1 Tax=Phyllopteryx taeniolatus TaxID=161469 RepID=UPI002AD26D29|nr:E3 ubiquitin-protein ligase RAD18 isoform X6 [Phyllopteryx taeniolatus]